MNLSPPVPWRTVPAGAVVLIGGVPRYVYSNTPELTNFYHTVVIEGDAPLRVDADATVQLVALDVGDAIGALAAAGLNPVIITPEESQ